MGLGEDFEPIIGDRGDDCLHPGYARTDLLFDSPFDMAWDGICLYNCLAAACNFHEYQQLSPPERVRSYLDMMAILTKKTFDTSLMASGIAFEVKQDGILYVPHYGSSPIVATVVRQSVSDGSGHLLQHYDLQQRVKDY